MQITEHFYEHRSSTRPLSACVCGDIKVHLVVSTPTPSIQLPSVGPTPFPTRFNISLIQFPLNAPTSFPAPFYPGILSLQNTSTEPPSGRYDPTLESIRHSKKSRNLFNNILYLQAIHSLSDNSVQINIYLCKRNLLLFFLFPELNKAKNVMLAAPVQGIRFFLIRIYNINISLNKLRYSCNFCRLFCEFPTIFFFYLPSRIRIRLYEADLSDRVRNRIRTTTLAFTIVELSL